jgi:hypothetical protein
LILAREVEQSDVEMTVIVLNTAIGIVVGAATGKVVMPSISLEACRPAANVASGWSRRV